MMWILLIITLHTFTMEEKMWIYDFFFKEYLYCRLLLASIVCQMLLSKNEIQKSRLRGKKCHNFNKRATVYSEMLSFRFSNFQFKTKKKKMYKSFNIWAVCEDVFVLTERKGLAKDIIVTMIVIIITKLGINRTGKHNLHQLCSQY